MTQEEIKKEKARAEKDVQDIMKRLNSDAPTMTEGLGSGAGAAGSLAALAGTGNRGMGLPAPFMGLLRMFDNINIGDINIGKTVEYMYVKGYDFRQFVVTSIPVAIMEILLRVFYIVKQMNVYNVNFQDAFVETTPLNLNPKFRMMLALSYGTFAGVNAGKVYVTKNILNANYAAWMGFAWNTFFALKWALLDKHLKLGCDLEKKRIAEIEYIIVKREALQSRAEFLNIKPNN